MNHKKVTVNVMDQQKVDKSCLVHYKILPGLHDCRAWNLRNSNEIWIRSSKGRDKIHKFEFFNSSYLYSVTNYHFLTDRRYSKY